MLNSRDQTMRASAQKIFPTTDVDALYGLSSFNHGFQVQIRQSEIEGTGSRTPMRQSIWVELALVVLRVDALIPLRPS